MGKQKKKFAHVKKTGNRVDIPWKWGWLALLLPVCCLLFFVLPWHVPVKGPIVSESYSFGFSNVTAHLVLAATLAALFLLRLSAPQTRKADGDFLDHVFTTPAALTRLQAASVVFCSGLSAFVVVGWWSLLPYGNFGEATYFLTRLDRLILGQIPFRDFDFGYGPAMLWLPYGMCRLSGGLVPIDSAYIISVVLHYVCGILCVDYILRCLRLSGGWRAGLLVFCTLATLNITLGVIYTPLRFVYAVWGILIIHHSLDSKKIWPGWVAALLVPLGGLLLSPECGLVTCIAAATGLLWHLKYGRQALASRTLAVLAAGFLVVYILGGDYFGMILFFGGGAMNFPIVPAPYVWSLLLASCWILPRMAVAACASAGGKSPMYASFLVALGLFLPAALGRCDPGHVLLNGLLVLVVSFAAALQGKPRFMRYVLGAGALTAYVTTQISFWNHYDKLIGNVFEIRKIINERRTDIDRGEAEVLKRLADGSLDDHFNWAKRLPFNPDLLDLLRYKSIGTPMGVTEDMDRFLKVTGRYVPEYFVPPLGGTFNPDTVARKIAYLDKVEILLVPESIQRHLQPVDPAAYGKWWSKFIGKLFLFPVDFTVVNQPYIPDEDIVKWMESNFVQDGSFRDYFIIKRVKPVSSP